MVSSLTNVLIMREGLIVICLCCSLLSCTISPSQHTDGETIEVDVNNIADTLYLSKCMKDISKIRVQLPDTYVWGMPDEVLFSENDIFIKDMKTEHLFHFSKDGIFLNTIGKRGNGPGEYTKISSCFLKENYIYINDLSARRIYKYSFDGNVVQTINYPMSIVYKNITSLPNDLFLCYSPSPIHENSDGLWTMNSTGERTENIFPNEEIYPYINTQWNSLYTINEELIGVYYSPTTSYYTLNKNTLELKKTYQQRVNTKTLMDYRGVKNVLDIDRDFTYCPMSFDVNNWIFSMWASQEYSFFSLYSKKNKENRNYKNIKNDFPGYNMFGLPISTNLNNSIVTFITDEFSEYLFPDEEQKIGVYSGTAVIQIMEFK